MTCKPYGDGEMIPSLQDRDWISWELAKDRYKVSEIELEIRACSNPKICDSNKKMVLNLWERLTCKPPKTLNPHAVK